MWHSCKASNNQVLNPCSECAAHLCWQSPYPFSPTPPFVRYYFYFLACSSTSFPLSSFCALHSTFSSLGMGELGPCDSSWFIGFALQGYIPPCQTKIGRRRAEAIERRLHQACCQQCWNVFVTLPDGWTAPAQQGLWKADSKSHIPEGGEERGMERRDAEFPYISMSLLSFLPSMSLAAYYKVFLH